MARQPYPSADYRDPRVRRLMDSTVKLNLVRMMAWSEGTVEAVLRLSDGVLNRTSIAPRVRQMALLRLCAVIPSEYEFAQLASVSRGEGFTEADIALGRAGSAARELTDQERLACRFAEELAAGPRASDATFSAMNEAFGPRQTLELATAVGFYLMQSRIIETFGVDFEDPPVDLSRRDTSSDAIKAWRDGLS